MTKDEKITAARAMLDAMGLTADDLAEEQDVAEPTIDDVLPVVNKPWVPKTDGECWRIGSDIIIYCSMWENDLSDKNRLSMGGVFPTEESAEARVQAMRDWEWLKQRSDRKTDDLFIPVEFHGHIIPGVGFVTYDKRDAAVAHIGPERVEVLARWLNNLGDE